MVDKIWYNMEELIGGSEERGINRNILECKVALLQGDVGLHLRINRNILECKGMPGLHCLRGICVLIETYWNVKLCSLSQDLIHRPVLIETYWNVKHNASAFLSDLEACINRNILECKGY